MNGRIFPSTISDLVENIYYPTEIKQSFWSEIIFNFIYGDNSKRTILKILFARKEPFIVNSLENDISMNVENIAQLIHRHLEKTNILPPDIQRDVNICRLRLNFVDENGDEINATKLNEFINSIECLRGVSVSDFLYLIGKYIIEHRMVDEDILKNGYIQLLFKKNHVTLILKISPFPVRLPSRYLKIGLKKEIQAEKLGREILNKYLEDSKMISVPEVRGDIEGFRNETDRVCIIGIAEAKGKSFREYYKEKSAKKVKEVLDILFTELIEKLYYPSHTPKMSISLNEHYQTFKTPDMDHQIRRYFEKRISTFCCAVHGDLHKNNLIVNVEGDKRRKSLSISIIDFGNVSEEKHYLMDFVALESSIRLELMDEVNCNQIEEEIMTLLEVKNKKSPKSLEEIKQVLQKPEEISKIYNSLIKKWLKLEETLDTGNIESTDTELIKAFQAIIGIRNRARNLAKKIGQKDELFMREYQIALLWYLYRFITYDIPLVKKVYAIKLIEKIENDLRGGL